MSRVLDEQAVSGMASLGTTPYLRTRARNMSHWPPSEMGSASRCAMRRPDSGSSSVSRTFSRNQLLFSTLSKNRG